MKKFILSLVAVLAVSVSSFAAENTNVDKTTVKNKMNKMDIKAAFWKMPPSTFRKLSRMLCRTMTKLQRSRKSRRQ